MGLEAFSQILDGIAFFLITPEFLGEERLRHFRHYLSNIVSKMSVWLEQSPQLTTHDAFGTVIGGAITSFLSSLIFVDFNNTEFSSTVFGKIIEAGMIFVVLSFTGYFLLAFCLLITVIVRSVLVRGVAFAIGAGLFLLSRCVMIWLKWHVH